MFEGKDFEELVKRAVIGSAQRRGLPNYNPQIIAKLVRLARENEPYLLQEEMKKSASMRRGVNDAVVSLNKVMNEAAGYAALEKRATLTMEDFDKAYKAHYCRIWPLCRP